MPLFRLPWLLALCVLFAACWGTDLFLNREQPDASGALMPDRLLPNDFFAATAAGELSAGRIIYRLNAAGLADLVATRTRDGRTSSAQTTAKLSADDLRLLRENHFTEDDAATVAAARPVTARLRAGLIVHAITPALGVLTGVATILFGVSYFAARQTSFSPGKMRAATSAVKFSAVAGCDEAKDEVHEVVEFLKDPARFRSTGGRMPKGVLLVGPPGTGKTMLAKAVAGEAKAHFYSVSGSDFVELYVGVGAARVRSLFKKARETAPSIIFIDEIDSVGRKRSSADGGGSQQEHDQTLNALLVAMDGFDSGDAVVVFGATNRLDNMDSALLRPAVSIARFPSVSPMSPAAPPSSKSTPVP